jgi:hypothetical protein
MSLKIVVKLPGTHDNCITDFLHPRIILLGPYQDLQNKVYREHCSTFLPSFMTSFSWTMAPLKAECVVETQRMIVLAIVEARVSSL